MRADYLIHGWPVSLDKLAAANEPYTPEFWRAYLATPTRRPFWRKREFAYLLIFAAVLVAAIVISGRRFEAGP